MEAKDVKIGLKVIPEGCLEDLSEVQDIPDQDGYVLCKYPSGQVHEVHHKHLRVYDEAAEKLAIEKAQSQLNESVDLFQQAFAKLQAAEQTARAVDLSLGYGDHFDRSKLNEVVEENGWSSSSIWC